MEEEGESEGVGTVVQAPTLRRSRHRWDSIWKEESVVEPRVCNTWQRVITDEREVV